mmetsp:Transcript_74298/g.187204  ORF Transcript_74298/g.187204 Transcript_74298/m.187204 type:complete len:277 (+) Transcript_74298:211-1041(+)
MLVAPLSIVLRREVRSVEPVLPNRVEGVGKDCEAHGLAQIPAPEHGSLHLATDGKLDILHSRVPLCHGGGDVWISAHVFEALVGRCEAPAEVVEARRPALPALEDCGRWHGDLPHEEVRRHVVGTEAACLPIVGVSEDLPELVVCLVGRYVRGGPLLRDACVPAVDQIEVECWLVAGSLIVEAAAAKTAATIESWPNPVAPLPQLSEATSIRGVLTEHLVSVLPEDDVDEDCTHDEASLLVEGLVGRELIWVPHLELLANVVVLPHHHRDDRLCLW